MDDCRKIEVVGARCKGKNRKTWKVCVVDKIIEVLGLHPEWVVFRDVWRDLGHHMGKRLTLA